MELQYYGGNCIKLITKKASIVIDDNLTELGGKSVTKAGDICLFTGEHEQLGVDTKIIIDQPGEYEVSDISIEGIPARAHMDEAGTTNATMYRLLIDDLRVAVVGHVYPELSGAQLEALNTIDVLIIPTGGNGYTIDPVGALKLVKDIEPKLIIPTHYDEKGLSYPVTQQPLEEVLKAMGMEVSETTAKFKIKPADLSEGTKLIVLERQ